MLKKILYIMGILLFIILTINYYFPYGIERVVNDMDHFFNESPKENVIQLDFDKNSRLYHVDAKINGHEINFILDTGCTSILIPKKEFLWLKKNDYFSFFDYEGEISTTNADGVETICEVYNISELQIGDYIVNDVNCVVANDNNAMFLLGQEVLQKFSKVTIDYDNHTLKLER